MKIEFKILPIMDLRRSPGEILDRVAEDGDVFVVERKGQQMAFLVPVSFLIPNIPPERISAEMETLLNQKEHPRTTINERKEIEFSFHEVAAGENVFVNIVLPHGYPGIAPKIYVTPIPKNTPGLWQDGSIQAFGVNGSWNPKKSNVYNALLLGRKWLRSFAKWKIDGKWSEVDMEGKSK